MLKVELQLTEDGRLLLVEHIVEDTNVWIHPDGKVTRVTKLREAELVWKGLEAVDNYNKEQMFRRNVRP